MLQHVYQYLQRLKQHRGKHVRGSRKCVYVDMWQWQYDLPVTPPSPLWPSPWWPSGSEVEQKSADFLLVFLSVCTSFILSPSLLHSLKVKVHPDITMTSLFLLNEQAPVCDTDSPWAVNQCGMYSDKGVLNFCVVLLMHIWMLSGSESQIKSTGSESSSSELTVTLLYICSHIYRSMQTRVKCPVCIHIDRSSITLWPLTGGVNNTCYRFTVSPVSGQGTLGCRWTFCSLRKKQKSLWV